MQSWNVAKVSAFVSGLRFTTDYNQALIDENLDGNKLRRANANLLLEAGFNRRDANVLLQAVHDLVNIKPPKPKPPKPTAAKMVRPNEATSPRVMPLIQRFSGGAKV